MRVLKITVMAALLVMAASVAFAGPTYDRVMSTKVIKAGITNQGIPAGFINDKNEWVGFDVDIATEIAKRLGCKLEKTVVNNNTRITFLQTTPPKVDMTLANMTHKRVRDEQIDFSITYFYDGQKILTRKGAVKDIKELAKMKVGSMQGTTSIINVSEYLKTLGNPDPKVIGYDGEIAMFEALRSGRVQAISTDATILLGYAAKEPGKYELVGDFISDEPYGIGLPQDDSKWRDTINFTLQDMWKDGTYKNIYMKWFGPNTPYNFPLTEKLEMWP